MQWTPIRGEGQADGQGLVERVVAVLCEKCRTRPSRGHPWRRILNVESHIDGEGSMGVRRAKSSWPRENFEESIGSGRQRREDKRREEKRRVVEALFLCLCISLSLYLSLFILKSMSRFSLCRLSDEWGVDGAGGR